MTAKSFDESMSLLESSQSQPAEKRGHFLIERGRVLAIGGLVIVLLLCVNALFTGAGSEGMIIICECLRNALFSFLFWIHQESRRFNRKTFKPELWVAFILLVLKSLQLIDMTWHNQITTLLDVQGAVTALVLSLGLNVMAIIPVICVSPVCLKFPILDACLLHY